MPRWFKVSAALMLSSFFWAACSPVADPAPTETAVLMSSTPTQAATATAEPTARPDPTSSPTHTPTSTELPTEAPEPTATFVPLSAGPFLDSGEQSIFGPDVDHTWESLMIFTAGLVEADDVYYQYYTGLGARWPEQVGIGVATSSDGITWSRAVERPVLTADGIPFAVQTILGSSALVMEDGTWVLYFYSIGTPDHDVQGASWIGRATADNPFGPFTADAEPVLLPGPQGAWDAFSVNDPHVIQVQEAYWMYYDGAAEDPEEGGRESIGLAFSLDGISWSKHNVPDTADAAFAESDPVFTASSDEAAWDAERVGEPNVIQTEDGWLMFYVSDRGRHLGRQTFGLGYAVSQDGVAWTRGNLDPLISTSDKSWFWLFTVSALEIDGAAYVYYSARPDRNPATVNVYMFIQNGELFED